MSAQNSASDTDAPTSDASSPAADGVTDAPATTSDGAAGRTRKLRKFPQKLLVALMTLTLLAVIGFGASRPQAATPPPVTSTTVGASSTVPTPSASVSLPPAPALKELEAQVKRIEAEQQVNLGIAIVPVGKVSNATTQPWAAGTLTTGHAWSTIDVPIAIAVVRGEKQPEDLEYLLNRSLVDGSAAGDDALYSFLGNETEAAAKTTAILREAGDSNTVVPAVSPRAGESAYTQTEWSLADQAQFLAGAYCMADSWPLLTKMDNFPADKVWGLAKLSRSQVKGGVGTEAQGNEVVRQFGIIVLNDGSKVAVAVLAMALDGSASTAVKAVDELAATLPSQALGLGPGYCVR